MKMAFLILLLLLFPLSSAWACLPTPISEKQRQEKIANAYYIGPVEILESNPINYPSPKTDEERIKLALSPTYTVKANLFLDYRDQRPLNSMKSVQIIELLPFSECGAEPYKPGTMIEASVIEEGDKYFLSSTLLRASDWKKFRQKKDIVDFMAANKFDCTRKGMKWAFPYGGVAECAE